MRRDGDVIEKAAWGIPEQPWLKVSLVKVDWTEADDYLVRGAKALNNWTARQARDRYAVDLSCWEP